jgi:hypothetical protein
MALASSGTSTVNDLPEPGPDHTDQIRIGDKHTVSAPAMPISKASSARAGLAGGAELVASRGALEGRRRLRLLRVAPLLGGKLLGGLELLGFGR